MKTSKPKLKIARLILWKLQFLPTYLKNVSYTRM